MSTRVKLGTVDGKSHTFTVPGSYPVVQAEYRALVERAWRDGTGGVMTFRSVTRLIHINAAHVVRLETEPVE